MAMSTPDISADRRTVLWDAMLDAEMNSCYWDLVSARYAGLDLAFKIIIAIAASGTVAGWGLWAQYPDAWKFFSGVACIASIAHPYICSADKLKRTSKLVGSWKEIFIDYELLWYKDDDLEASESWTKFDSIKRREGKIDESQLPRWNGMLEKAFRHVLAKRGLTHG
jgi:hypothetical protein